MKVLYFLFCYLACTHIARSQTKTPQEDWDLARNYHASSQVFYGEVLKVIPEPNFKPGSMGVKVRDISDNELALQQIVWQQARELTFKVEQPLKESIPQLVQAILPDPDFSVWTHITNAAGDHFLAKPNTPNALLKKLRSGDRGLFFIRPDIGSNTPIVYQVRFGQEAENDLALIQQFQHSDGQTLEAVILQAKKQARIDAAQEIIEFRRYEDEYYEILRIPDLEIRRSLLLDLIERMGFKGEWTYFDFKERYLKAQGAHPSEKNIPSGPTTGKEKVWHDASGELRKIDLILKIKSGQR
jgi:hypothetical protein